MLFAQATTILGLAAGLGSAVDIGFYASSTDCTGTAVICSNVASNRCCVLSGSHRSVRFVAAERLINVRADSNRCTSIGFGQNVRPPYCLSSAGQSTFNSAQWREAILLKRAPEVDQCPAGPGGCKEFVRPDLIVIPDGTKYYLKDLDDVAYEKLYGNPLYRYYYSTGAAANDAFAVAKDVPEEFSALRIDA
ncbi:uncharacterized protein PpBr36_10211 [Pyricularia pennisetigena]|uniref:uncharacterized protein n=1 Tax=Pyricularia pennisetigena TaxID=1578925 RepID=UPI00114DAFC1|nr:uncharacterized protein PpBr36_10211 [Pyricularia pennisetigena]TLS21520.1 hypothetical protein PpBr36_10211 [Pyricularia pennisetigena]